MTLTELIDKLKKLDGEYYVEGNLQLTQLGDLPPSVEIKFR